VNQATPQLELDNQLCFALYNASRAMTRAYGPLLAELGLTYPQYLAMLVLWESDDTADAITVGALGDRLHLDSGTLTPLLKRLAEVGFVARDRDPADERRVLITLTTAGEELRARAAEVPAKAFACFGLEPAAALILKEQLATLAESLEA
jgi:DNA-binding MarR family transcriptional regulator